MVVRCVYHREHQTPSRFRLWAFHWHQRRVMIDLKSCHAHRKTTSPSARKPDVKVGPKLPACWPVGLEAEEAGSLFPTQWLKLIMADARQGAGPRMGSSSLLTEDKKCFYQPLPRPQIHTYQGGEKQRTGLQPRKIWPTYQMTQWLDLHYSQLSPWDKLSRNPL